MANDQRDDNAWKTNVVKFQDSSLEDKHCLGAPNISLLLTNNEYIVNQLVHNNNGLENKRRIQGRFTYHYLSYKHNFIFLIFLHFSSLALSDLIPERNAFQG